MPQNVQFRSWANFSASLGANAQLTVSFGGAQHFLFFDYILFFLTYLPYFSIPKRSAHKGSQLKYVLGAKTLPPPHDFDINGSWSVVRYYGRKRWFFPIAREEVFDSVHEPRGLASERRTIQSPRLVSGFS